MTYIDASGEAHKIGAACVGCDAALICMNTDMDEVGKPLYKRRCCRCGILYVLVSLYHLGEKTHQCVEVLSRCPREEYKTEWVGNGTHLASAPCPDCNDYLAKHGGAEKWKEEGYPKTKDFQKNVARSLAVPDVSK